jgi:hypothetical protein
LEFVLSAESVRGIVEGDDRVMGSVMGAEMGQVTLGRAVAVV